ncbi:MAG: phosphoribosylformylglycinamidine cyclo-ligase [Bacteroidota bacterium]|nr:phosphoribosylformylglycinamidine cyclo-ligase [Bacteroidota bacterium]MDE2957223.1 phosphoribosylformylglycinamidine cyclo-ligase [Bacteroidota bacterium]
MTTYREAGVDIDAAADALSRMKPLINSTFTPNVIRDVGAFGGFYSLDLSKWSQPVLVSSMDGVGTKVKVAIQVNRHNTIGEDLVNHSVNDIAVCGAEPLYFLDYFATARLVPKVAEAIMQGLTRACRQSGIALIGGETAEMPDIYMQEDYDLAGTVVGMVEKDRIMDGSQVRRGDVLLGLPSSGLHTNGYTLARRVLMGPLSVFQPDDRPEELAGESVAEALLQVHRNYLGVIRDLRPVAHAFVHVTGGGIGDNTRRVIPEDHNFTVEYSAWERPPIFGLIQRHGNVPENDMRRTFNLGIGLVVAVAPSDVDAVMDLAARHNETPIRIGSVQ